MAKSAQRTVKIWKNKYGRNSLKLSMFPFIRGLSGIKEALYTHYNYLSKFCSILMAMAPISEAFLPFASFFN